MLFLHILLPFHSIVCFGLFLYWSPCKRAARAYETLGFYERAERAMRTAVKLEPENRFRKLQFGYSRRRWPEAAETNFCNSLHAQDS